MYVVSTSADFEAEAEKLNRRLFLLGEKKRACDGRYYVYMFYMKDLQYA
jgi:hypothetical protein